MNLHVVPSVVLLAVFSAAAQKLPEKQLPEKDFTLTAESDLVVLDVAVLDSHGNMIPDLKKENFRVYENGKLQTITEFGADDRPITAGLVIDSSGSMSEKRPDVVTGGLAFVRDSNPQDEIFVTEFNDRVVFGLPPTMPFSGDSSVLRTALIASPAQGRTALYDAVLESLDHLRQGDRSKKALILISDGGDNASRHGLADVTNAVLKSPATIYTVGIFDEYDRDRNPGLLRKLASVTGGEAYFPKRIPDVVTICRRIARQIRQRYTIAYRPVRTTDQGELRTIKVVVAGAPRRATVFARKSYYLPEAD